MITSPVVFFTINIASKMSLQGGWGKGWGKVQYIKDGVLISAVIGCCKHSSGILKV